MALLKLLFPAKMCLQMDYCFVWISIMDTSVERVKFQLSHFQMYTWLEETASSLLGADNADDLEWRLLVVACIFVLYLFK